MAGVAAGTTSLCTGTACTSSGSVLLLLHEAIWKCLLLCRKRRPAWIHEGIRAGTKASSSTGKSKSLLNEKLLGSPVQGCGLGGLVRHHYDLLLHFCRLPGTGTV